MTRFFIRRAGSADATTLSTLMMDTITETNAADYPPTVISRLIYWHRPEAVAVMIDRRRVFIALDTDEISGTIALDGKTLRGLFVAPLKQRRGIARALVEHVEAEARAAGTIEVTLQSSLTARTFYEHLGYRTQAFRYHSEGSTYRMVKAL